jgi:hypothetical protein
MAGITQRRIRLRWKRHALLLPPDADIISSQSMSRREKKVGVFDHTLIKRQGSYLYARSFWIIVILLTAIYGGMGAVLAIITDSDLEDVLDQIIFPILAFIPVLMMWVSYGAVLLAFKREANCTIELSEDGIRESRLGRERRFIPWAGVREIEMSADLLGGMSLKAKGAFSEISISNVDLEITRPMSITRMHRALTRANQMRTLFGKLRAAAPQAALRMNKLARRKMTSYSVTQT